MKDYLSKEEQNRQFHLGYNMAFGVATKRRNWNNIVALWRSAATHGHKSAQFYLGTCYDHGLGVKKDTREAFEWFTLSAKQGDTEAQRDLGYAYFYATGSASPSVGLSTISKKQGYWAIKKLKAN